MSTLFSRLYSNRFKKTQPNSIQPNSIQPNSTKLIKNLFCKENLLSNLIIEDNGWIALRNEHVEIALIIPPIITPPIITPQQIKLYGFYQNKTSTKSSKGMTRCALYFILLHLLGISRIKLTDTIDVSNPTPDNDNMARLIKIYKQIGFNHLNSTKSKPIKPILSNTVENIIEALSKQCGEKEESECITRGGSIRKTKIRKSKKRH